MKVGDYVKIRVVPSAYGLIVPTPPNGRQGVHVLITKTPAKVYVGGTYVFTKKQIELKTFFDEDGEPERKAKALVEENRTRFRHMRIEKRLIGML